MTRGIFGWCALVTAAVVAMGCSDDGNGAMPDGGSDAGMTDPCEGVTGDCVAITGDTGDIATELQTAFINATDGQTIAIAAGTIDMKSELNLADANGVTIKGMGPDATVLSFADVPAGAGGNGILVENVTDGVTIEDLAVEDTQADGITIRASKNAVLRNVRVEWTEGLSMDNGRYGIYPVQTDGVLVENCLAIGASDAGIYVGESKNIIVRDSEAHDNVAGFQVENSFDSESYNNYAHGNTAGMMWHDLPGKTFQKNGGRHLAHDNDIEANNAPNVGAMGAIVSELPSGLGGLIMAVDDVEWRNNTVKNNQTVNLAVVSFWIAGDPTTDPSYDPYPERIYVHDNDFEGGGDMVDTSGQGGVALASLNALSPNAGMPIPDMVYDHITSGTPDPGAPNGNNPSYICFENNTEGTGDATFMNLDGDNIDLTDPSSPNLSMAMPSLDITDFTCTGETQSPITLSFAP